MNPLRRSVLLHFHNHEILAAYGQGTRRPDELLRATALLTRYALVLSEGRLIVMPKFLWEAPYFGRYLRLISPIVSAGLLSYAGSSAGFADELNDKRVQYRDSPQLFPTYFDPDLSEKQLGVLDRLVWVRRLGPSATSSIATAWRESLGSGGDLAQMVAKFSSDRDVGGSHAERQLESVPADLDGRAFVLAEVERLLRLPLDSEARTRINWLINQAYVKLYLGELDAALLVDTPLGALDFGLAKDQTVAPRLISQSRVAVGLSMVGLRVAVESMPWGDLIELRHEVAFRWLLDEIAACAAMSTTREMSTFEVALRNRVCAQRLLDLDHGIRTLKEVRYRLAILLELIPPGAFGDSGPRSDRLGTLILPSHGWLRRRRRSDGMGKSPEGEGAAQLRLPGSGGVDVCIAVLTVTPDEMRPVLLRLGDSVTTERKRRWYSKAEVMMPGGRMAEVVVTNSGEQGGISAVNCARDILADYEPDVLFLVGIGGGLPSTDYTLGDVVLARSVQDLRVRAVLEDGTEEFSAVGTRAARPFADLLAHLPGLESRLSGWSTSDALGVPRPVLDIDSILSYGPDPWKARVRDTLRHHFEGGRDAPRVVSGAIVSTDALVKSTHFAANVQLFVRHTAAFEMEAAGVFRAAEEPNRTTPVLVVKGVSDLVGLTRDDAWTSYAAHAAASFAIELISSGVLVDTLGFEV